MEGNEVERAVGRWIEEKGMKWSVNWGEGMKEKMKIGKEKKWKGELVRKEIKGIRKESEEEKRKQLRENE